MSDIVVGTKVFIPSNFKVRKTQKRFCIVEAIKPEEGRGYATLRGITRLGISKSDRQVVYWPLGKLDRLEFIRSSEQPPFPREANDK